MFLSVKNEVILYSTNVFLMIFFSDASDKCTESLCIDTKYQSVFVLSEEKDECIIATEVSQKKPALAILTSQHA